MQWLVELELVRAGPADLRVGDGIADTDEVCARVQCSDGAWTGSDGVAYRGHVDGIRDENTLKAELASDVEARAVERGGSISQCGHADVRTHQCLRARFDRRAERRQMDAAQLFDRDVGGRGIQMGVGHGVAVAGKVLGAGGDACALDAAHICRSVTGDDFGVRAE